MMKKLEVALEPHPWQQFRYPLDKKGENEPPTGNNKVDSFRLNE